MLVQIHCYRADELLNEMAMAKEFGYNLRAFHHGLEAYKVAISLPRITWGWRPLPTGGDTSTKRGTRFRGTR